VLLLCNFGDRRYLDLLGSTLDAPPSPDRGSCIAVSATDAPLSGQALRRLALRPLLGLARSGSYACDGSGEIGIAFSTGAPAADPGEELDRYFAAAYEAAQEAVYNCLVAARPAERLDGEMQEAFPVDAVRRLAEARADLPEL
jgi:D-aminopeptidase